MSKSCTGVSQYIGLTLLHASIAIAAASVEAAPLAPTVKLGVKINDVGKACKLSPKCVNEASSAYSEAMTRCDTQFPCVKKQAECTSWDSPKWVEARNSADKALSQCYARNKKPAQQIQNCNPEHKKIYSKQWVGLKDCDASYRTCDVAYKICQNQAKTNNTAALNAIVK